MSIKTTKSLGVEIIYNDKKQQTRPLKTKIKLTIEAILDFLLGPKR